MENKNKLTVYLSYSLQDKTSKFQTVKSALEQQGFKVVYHIRGENYDKSKLERADLVLFLHNGLYDSEHFIDNIYHYDYFVGKGQFSEAQICYKKDIPAFMFHTITVDSELLVTKLTDKFRGTVHTTFDTNEWKSQYGIINSHSVGVKTINLYNFIENMPEKASILISAVKDRNKKHLNKKLFLL